MNEIHRYVDALLDAGLSRSHAARLLKDLGIPQVAGLRQALQQFLKIVDVARDGFPLTESSITTLEEYATAAESIIATSAETPFSSLVDQSPGDITGYYGRYPLYSLMLCSPSTETPIEEYQWLCALVVLASLAGPIDSTRQYRWALAARAFGESGAGELIPPPQMLHESLSGVVRGTDEPGRALTRLKRISQSSERRRHAADLISAWRYLNRSIDTRESGSTRAGRGGYRFIRGGLPPGRYASEYPIRLHGLGREWGAAEAWHPDSESKGRGGDAPGDAATPGEVVHPEESADDDFAVPYYERKQAYAAYRHRQHRRASAGQDTLPTTAHMTPSETAHVVMTLLELRGEDSPRANKGSAQALLGLITGLPEARLMTAQVVDHLEEQVADSVYAVLTRDGYMAWRPQALTRQPAGPQHDDLVHPSSAWITVPMPGLLVSLLPALELPTPAGALNDALRAVHARTGIRLTYSDLQRYWWGQLALATSQPSVATAMTGQARPSTYVPQHYLHLPTTTQAAAYRDAYARFLACLRPEYDHQGRAWPTFLGPPAMVPPAHERPGYGSKIVPRTGRLPSALAECVMASDQGLSGPMARAQRSTTALYHIISLLYGIRGVRARPGYAALASRGLRTISDKDTALFKKARILSLPTRTRQRIGVMWQRRANALSLAGFQKPPTHFITSLPSPRAELIEMLRSQATPSLSYIDIGSKKSLRLLYPEAMRQRYLDIQALPTNWNRHLIRTLLVTDRISDQHANLHMGHAVIGQDQWSSTSCLRPSEAASRVVEHLASRLELVITRLERP